MNISNIGEFELIKRIEKQSSKSMFDARVLGIGDDCAIFPMNEGQDGLLTTDLLLEGVHFTEETISLSLLGAKALEVNVSDIAAMGGIPLYATVSLAVHSDIELLDIEAFYNGLLEAARRHKVALVGGDTSYSPGPMFVSLSIVGQVEKGRAFLRSQAQAGDLVCVSGSLGGSHVGLKWLLSGLSHTVGQNCSEQFREMIDYCCERHTSPNARVNVGRALQKAGVVHACIDLSDGLASDLDHILGTSGVGAVIELDRLPLDPRVREMAKILDIDPIKAMTTGGEDYELLFTIPQDCRHLLETIQHTTEIPLSVIGKITVQQGPADYLLNGQPFDYQLSGFDHFRRPE